MFQTFSECFVPFQIVCSPYGPFWLFWSILDHYRSFLAVFLPFQVVTSQFWLFWAILGRFGSFQIWKVIGGYGLFQTVLGCLGPFLTISVHYRLFQVILGL
jgi:hypothetical protein